jgi:hypothetical protein
MHYGKSLNVDIYRKPESSESHNVHRNPTQTNLCLNSQSHHLPSNRPHTIIWCTRPVTLATKTAYILKWIFWGPLSGRTATETDSSEGSSTHRTESHCPLRNLPRSVPCHVSARFSTAFRRPTSKDHQLTSASKGWFGTQDLVSRACSVI